MNETRAWHDDDTFWETMAPKMFGEAAWLTAIEQMDHVVTLLRLTPDQIILDLCCGPGRHSLTLARRGFRVTGVDRTAAYLARARQQAEAESLAVEWVQDDMRTFCRPAAFDGVLSMFTSFGYFADQAENRQVLENIYRSLKPGGAVLIDTMGKEVLARIFRERDWYEQDGILFLEERKISQSWAEIEARWIMIQGAERHEFAFSHHLYAASELQGLLKSVGFSAADAYGDLTGTSYDQNARRLVVVGRKE